MKKTILLDERARGRCASEEIDAGGIGKGNGSRRVLFVVPEDERGSSLIRHRIGGGVINEGSSLRIHGATGRAARAGDSHEWCACGKYEVEVLCSRISGLVRRGQEELDET
jgi:hypothetical protein